MLLLGSGRDRLRPARGSPRRWWFVCQMVWVASAVAWGVPATAEPGTDAKDPGVAVDAAPVIEAMHANEALAARLADVHQRLEGIVESQRGLRVRLEEVRELRDTAVDQLAIAKSGGTLGRVLHRQRQELPSLMPEPQEARKRGEAIAQARVEQMELRAERKALARGGDTLDERLAPFPEQERHALRPVLKAELERGAQLRERLDRAYTHYITELTSLDQLARQLAEVTDDYAELLSRDLVWVADARRPNWHWPLSAFAPLRALVEPGVWRELLLASARSWRLHPLVLSGALLAVGLGFFYRGRLRVWLERFAAPVGDPERDRFRHTAGAVLVSLLLATRVPLTFGFAALVLGGGAGARWLQALSEGLGVAALVALVLELARVFCRDEGLLGAHLGWPRGPRQVVTRALYMLLPALVVSTLVVAATNALGEHLDTLGRAAFVLGAIALTLFIGRALHPEGGLLSLYFVDARRHGWPWNLRSLWFGAFASVPLVLAVLALAGYYFTAQEVLARFCATLVLGALVVLGTQIALRGLRLFELRLARRQVPLPNPVAERRDVGVEMQGEATVSVEDDQKIDLSAVDAQVRGFLKIIAALVFLVGVWWIWVDLLPALAALRESRPATAAIPPPPATRAGCAPRRTSAPRYRGRFPDSRR